MLYRPLGTSGMEASVIAFGAWAIGGVWWGGSDEDEAIGAIRAAVDSGINLIDTAPIYGFGRSEAVIGKAIAGFREKVLIATKCGMRWDGPEIGQFHAEASVPGVEKPVRIYRNLRPDSIRAELKGSLRRLGTSYVDLYQTHWQDATSSIAETMDCLMALQTEGKIRAIGVSNASIDDLGAYREAGMFHADQERFSMLDRHSAAANLEYCRERDLAFLAYSPLAHGLLTGKVNVDRTFARGDFRREHERFTPAEIKRVQGLLDRLAPLARDSNLTVAQLVIRWTLQQPGLTHVLCGARNAYQAGENARAGEALLGQDVIDAISRILNE
jgi:methylglyoxal reductase